MTMKLLCKLFGHSANPTDTFFFEVENSAINRYAFIGNKLKCKRCGTVIKTIEL